MTYVKQHIFKLNTSGHGYLRFTGDPESGFRQRSFSNETNEVPRSYGSAERRLEEFLEKRKSPWSLTFRHDSGDLPLVAYGGFLEAPDERGRNGIYYIHGMQINDVGLLVPSVASIVALLSMNEVEQLVGAVEAVAIGKSEAQEVLKKISTRVESLIGRAREEAARDAGPSSNCITSIEHDCAGASSTAWLTFAYQQSTAISPWEVYDALNSSGDIGSYSTGSPQETVAASSIQRQAISVYLKGISQKTTQDVSNRADEAKAQMKPQADPLQPSSETLALPSEGKGSLHNRPPASDPTLKTKTDKTKPPGTPSKVKKALAAILTALTQYTRLLIWPVTVIAVVLINKYDIRDIYKPNALHEAQRESQVDPRIADLPKEFEELKSRVDEIANKQPSAASPIQQNTPPARRHSSRARQQGK